MKASTAGAGWVLGTNEDYEWPSWAWSDFRVVNTAEEFRLHPTGHSGLLEVLLQEIRCWKCVLETVAKGDFIV